MTEHDQIKAVAELDGFYLAASLGQEAYPAYLTSYDAIIPVIQKQSTEIIYKTMEYFHWSGSEHTWIIAIPMATPAQLTVALLRAIGKWKD